MKPFYQSTNFWISVLLAGGALFVGFPEGQARDLVASMFGLISAFGVVRNYFKTGPQFEWKKFGSANFWNYVAAFVTAMVPVNLPPELFTSLQDMASAIIGGNWQGILVAVFSVASIVYHIIQSNTGPKEEAEKELKAV